MHNYYKLTKDQFNNDVIILNNKKIPLNKKNTSVDYQMTVLNYCVDSLDYSFLEVKDNLYVVKEYIDHNEKENYSFNIIDNGVINLFNGIENPCKDVSISFNDKYIVLWEMDYECPIVLVNAAYDIENHKLIDINYENTKKELVDSVVNKKRCLYDVIASILTDQILMIDQSRLFSFMSFIVNKKVNLDNYHQFVPQVKSYILKFYPKMMNKKLITDRKELLNMNEMYGIDYFKFSKIPFEIKNLKYISTKQKVK